MNIRVTAFAGLMAAGLAFGGLAVANTQPASTAAAAAAPASPYRVLSADSRIPFAESAIDGFRVGLDGSLILNAGSRWYRATLNAACTRDLRWEEAIAFRPFGGGALDKFDTITIDHRPCQIQTLDRIEDPRPVERAARAAKAKG